MVRLTGILALFASLALAALLAVAVERFEFMGTVILKAAGDEVQIATRRPAPFPRKLSEEKRSRDFMERAGVVRWRDVLTATGQATHTLVRLKVSEEAARRVRPSEEVLVRHYQWRSPVDRLGPWHTSLELVQGGEVFRLSARSGWEFLLSGLAIAASPLFLWGLAALIAAVSAPRGRAGREEGTIPS